jgi:chemotaxis protein methyltransferase CheR
MLFSTEDIRRLRELVYEKSHLSFSGGREEQFLRSVARMAAAGGHPSADSYLRAVRNNEDEFFRLIGAITTKETSFFRLPAHFTALREIVLPSIERGEGEASLHALAGGLRRPMSLRIWSAGCATGQEAYSLAVTVLEYLRYPRAWDIEILGTDIDPGSVDTAREGVYTAPGLAHVPPDLLARYFVIAGDGTVTANNTLRDITVFRAGNLSRIDDLPSGQRTLFDIIFCRNVLIYFDLLAQQRLITALSGYLKPGGWLFTGEGEVLHLYDHSLESVEHAGTYFFRKPINIAHDSRAPEHPVLS